MKTLICGLTMSFGILASAVNAVQMVNIGGIDYPLSSLMENCQSITDDPAAQIACFSALSKVMEEQSGEEKEDGVSVPQALDALRAVAQYQDDESGLSITASGCSIQILYFNNYYHLSRRNISSIDLFSVQFDVSKLQYDQITQVQGGSAPLSKGIMDAGATAAMRGGAALESSQQNFAPRSPRMTIDVYASEVVNQLPVTEDQTFEFVLVHPNRSQASADIWSAFEVFVKACQQ